MDPKAPTSPVQRLAQKWRVIGLLIVAFARLIRRDEDGHVAGAGPRAAQLQIIVRTAHVMLMQELAETLERAPPKSEADENALQHLRGIIIALLAMHFVLEAVVQRGLRAGPLWLGIPVMPGVGERRAGTPRSIGGVQILDPG